MKIRLMEAKDWQSVSRIYEEGIATRNATFETKSPNWEEWDANHVKSCRLVAETGGQVVGWAALSPVSNRCVYGGVAEVSIYISSKHRKKGIGRQLMIILINASEEEGFWTLQSGMFPENKGSIALHLRTGFRKIGVRKKIGKHFGVWRDNVILERRSQRPEFN